jgi:hypothetical protein
LMATATRLRLDISSLLHSHSLLDVYGQ